MGILKKKLPPPPDPSQEPIEFIGVQKFIIDGGREIYLYRPRRTRFINSTSIAGVRASDDGRVLSGTHTLIDEDRVERTVMVGFGAWQKKWVEIPEAELWTDK